MSKLPVHLSLSLLSLALCVGLLAPATLRLRDLHAQAPAVTVTATPASVPQGGGSLLRISAPGATAVRVVDGTATYPAHPRGDGWECVVPVFREVAPGAKTLTVEAEQDGRTATATTTLTVTKRDFPVQYLRMSASQSAKYEAPSVQEEYRLIGAALGHHAPARAWEGGFLLPAKGRISTRYGVQRYRNGEKVSVHKGIDIAAPKGAPVYAANGGMVTLRRDFGLHGRTLVVDHGAGVVGLYLHLNDFGVSEGQKVKKGQLIARVGSTGASTGPHLHYALYFHGVAIDPVLFQTLPAGW